MSAPASGGVGLAVEPGAGGDGPGGAGFLAARRRRKHEKRVVREARLLLGEVRGGLQRGDQGQLTPALREELQGDAQGLEKALGSGKPAEIKAAIAALDDKADRHLGFARKSTLREYAESIAIAVLFALLLRAFVVEAFKIPSGSMIPTLEVGDHIFVNKYLYGVRIPWTKTRFFTWRKPQRGEIIVFMFPENPSQDFIKRVVAVGGDTLEVRGNQLVVNGKLQPRELVDGEHCEFTDYNKDEVRWRYHQSCFLYRETLGGHVFYTMNLPHPRDPSHRDFPSTLSHEASRFLDDVHTPGDSFIRVPEGQVYVMGDNRDDSHDSRYWGGVPLENIKGKALIVWWSMGESITLDRLGRIGKLIY